MDFAAYVDEWIDGMAKPPASLGLMEQHVKKIFLAWGKMQPEIKPHHLVFAADNGIVEEGVVNYPAEITYLQAKNMVAGKATISCFCLCNQIPYQVVDVGIKSEDAVGTDRKVAKGTKNFLKEAAMNEAEYNMALQAGREMVRLAVEAGHNLLSFGEMGIGNTTTSSAVLHALSGMRPEFVVGYGAGCHNKDIVNRKRLVIARGVEKHKAAMKNEADIIRCVGGFDIAALCGAMLECADLNTPFVIDGFIAAVAYVCAARLNQAVERFGIPSHLSREPGMIYALMLGNILTDEVPIRANMALGEGTGALLMVGMLKTVLYTVMHAARMSDFGATVQAVSPPVAL
ncbi:phosphoribosyltransferase [Lucifera butyrica]|uniref:Nicotinate-nucleotide--dimethylbenzimidazole phosphoribosyltransferase n=1 Tax=Lucifera butyrica TaxID=1351585 RepID=A0A498R298_9FIRM|nr:nicotinate-nucleotide--dimethylbenzimidazole phosphoribosyltransferase [Lucifera butyrica]VBB05289.1 phosphoribosyltransferase [Lucifera butyrica]